MNPLAFKKWNLWAIGQLFVVNFIVFHCHQLWISCRHLLRIVAWGTTCEPWGFSIIDQPIISASNSLQPSLFIRARTACHRCQLSGRIFGPNIKKNILATPRKRYPGEVSPKNHHADFHQEIHVKSMKSTRTTMSSTTLEGNWLLQLQKFRDSDHVPYESCYLGVIFCHLNASK